MFARTELAPFVKFLAAERRSCSQRARHREPTAGPHQATSGYASPAATGRPRRRVRARPPAVIDRARDVGETGRDPQPPQRGEHGQRRGRRRSTTRFPGGKMNTAAATTRDRPARILRERSPTTPALPPDEARAWRAQVAIAQRRARIAPGSLILITHQGRAAALEANHRIRERTAPVPQLRGQRRRWRPRGSIVSERLQQHDDGRVVNLAYRQERSTTEQVGRHNAAAARNRTADLRIATHVPQLIVEEQQEHSESRGALPYARR